MAEIYFVTSNTGKVDRLNEVFYKTGIDIVQRELDIPEIQAPTLREMAEDKVVRAYKKLESPCVVVDSGFFIPVLGGFPGVYTKHVVDNIGVRGLLKLVEGLPRKCHFGNCLAYMGPEIEQPITFESEPSRGELTTEPSENKFPKRGFSDLTTIFTPAGYRRTEATMGETDHKRFREEREKVSFSTRFKDWYLNHRVSQSE